MSAPASARSRLGGLLGRSRSINRLLTAGRSVPLGHICGIRIGATPSWFVATALLIVVLAAPLEHRLDSSTSGGYVAAAIFALLATGSVLLHELGHALTARRLGIGITGIDLWIFGGVARLARGWESPGAELKVVVAGPAVTFLLVLVPGALAVLLGAGLSGDLLLTGAQPEASDAVTMFSFLVTINFSLLVFNLVPAYPLDGGALLHAWIWRRTGDHLRATRIAGRGGRAFAVVLACLGLWLAAQGAPVTGTGLVLIAWMLGQAAHVVVKLSVGLGETLEGMTVADVVDAGPVALALPATTTAIRAQEDSFKAHGWSYFPVVDDQGRLLGVVTDARVAGEIAAGRSQTEVRELVERVDASRWWVRPDQPLHALLVDWHLWSHGSLLVLDDDGVLRGVVTTHQLNLMLKPPDS